ncbi:hypothetical protein BH23GEM8_BH23GEM8_22810 [soil metagenome]
MKILKSAAIAAMLLAMAACAADEDTNDAMAVDAVEQDQMPMEGMPGMAGMQDDGMMRQMQARMATMIATNPDSVMAMMPMHRKMAANMLAQMNREMRGMDMAGDEAWTATVDSLRQEPDRDAGDEPRRNGGDPAGPSGPNEPAHGDAPLDDGERRDVSIRQIVSQVHTPVVRLAVRGSSKTRMVPRPT